MHAKKDHRLLSIFFVERHPLNLPRIFGFLFSATPDEKSWWTLFGFVWRYDQPVLHATSLSVKTPSLAFEIQRQGLRSDSLGLEKTEQQECDLKATFILSWIPISNSNNIDGRCDYLTALGLFGLEDQHAGAIHKLPVP